MNQFALESLSEISTGHKPAFPPGEGRIVHLKGHAQCGLVNAEREERLYRLRIT